MCVFVFILRGGGGVVLGYNMNCDGKVHMI